jgi:hypothetical protein
MMVQRGKDLKVAGSYSDAFDLFRTAADSGNPQGQAELSMMYAEGLGTQQDPSQAAEWMQKAAIQGFARAQYRLGEFYRTGIGVPMNFAEAVRWYQKAAEQNDKDAQNSLGYMYENGLGVSKDDEKARYWHRRADPNWTGPPAASRPPLDIAAPAWSHYLQHEIGVFPALKYHRGTLEASSNGIRWRESRGDASDDFSVDCSDIKEAAANRHYGAGFIHIRFQNRNYNFTAGSAEYVREVLSDIAAVCPQVRRP